MLIRSFDGGNTFSDTIRVSENNPSHKFRMGNIKIEIISGKKESEIVAKNDISSHIGKSKN